MIIVVRDPDNKTNIVGEFTVSTDFNHILELLGVDKTVFYNGFDDLEDIFKFLVTSKYFDVGAFILENRPSESRYRDIRRPNYMRMLEWFNENNIQSNYDFGKQDHFYIQKKEFVKLLVE